MPRFLPLIALLLASTTAFAGTFTTHEALEYASPDLRVPDTNGPHPVLVYLHSGAWITGNRFGGPAVRQASRGYAVASIEYRLAPQHIWPAQVQDTKAAVRWLRANAARFRLDPNRIALFGTSAGGHIASVAATSTLPEHEGLELGNPQFSSRVEAVVDLYGPTDLLKIEEDKLPCIPLDGNAPFMPPSLLMGCPIQECRDWTNTASPMTYATPDDPPIPDHARPPRLPRALQTERRPAPETASHRRPLHSRPPPHRRARRPSLRPGEVRADDRRIFGRRSARPHRPQIPPPPLRPKVTSGGVVWRTGNPACPPWPGSDDQRIHDGHALTDAKTVSSS
jgi:hypothetical protein